VLPAKASSLVRYDAARKALAEAHRVDEVKSIRDKAVAMQAYAKQAKDTELISKATEIRMRAERRAGELLRQMDSEGQRAKAGDRESGRGKKPLSRPTLADLGINKTQSSRWQKLADLPEEQFEVKVEGASKAAYNRIAQNFIKAQKIKEVRQQHGELIEHGCTVEDLRTLPAKHFGVIYADPAWLFDNWSPAGGVSTGPANHYSVCTPDQIAELPVARLAADDCVLLLWCTWPHIVIGTHLKVIKAWGFEPRTCGFVWVKTNADGNIFHGNGYYTRSNSEVCLLATRGKPLRLAANVLQIVMTPIGEHSEKPEEVRRRIERLFSGPYLELYGRKQVEGWTVWGNEIPRTRFRQQAA
jgi:N6-adenosine-specific RNA methylase IME4